MGTRMGPRGRAIVGRGGVGVGVCGVGGEEDGPAGDERAGRGTEGTWFWLFSGRPEVAAVVGRLRLVQGRAKGVEKEGDGDGVAGARGRRDELPERERERRDE